MGRAVSGFPPHARLFSFAAVVLTVAAVLWAALQVSGHLASALGFASWPDVTVSVVAALGIVVTGLYPICLGRNVRTSVTAVITFAAALLFSPLRATALVAPAVAAYWWIDARRHRWAPDVARFVVPFNAAQITLATGVTSILFHTLGPRDTSLLQLGNPQALGALAAAVVCYFLLNTGAVATMSALVHHESPWTTWLAIYRHTWHRNLSMLLVGVLLAITYLYTPPAAVLIAIPIVVIHQAYSSYVVIQRQTKETLELLADTIDNRDPHTFAHSQRVAALAREIAARLGLSTEDREIVAQAARLHDLGKLGIGERLLLKPQRLSEDELELVRKHAVIGAKIVGKLPEYNQGKEFILFHHERYDGTGIFGLGGTHIPLGARIIAAADAFDAMTSDRPYRKALTVEQALGEVTKQRGTQFDPIVADALVVLIRERGTAFLEEPAIPPPLPAVTPATSAM